MRTIKDWSLIVSSVLLALHEHAASNRELSSKATEGLKADISAVQELCTNLSKQIESRQNASEWREKFARVEMEHRALLQETSRLKVELVNMQNEAKAQLEKQDGLQQELTTLRAKAKATEELVSRIDNLERTKEEMEESLNEKKIRIQNLEDGLKKADEALDAQRRQLHEKEQQLHSEREEHARVISDHCEQQAQTVEQARTEESTRTRAQYRDIEKRLQNAEKDYSRLQTELLQVREEANNALKVQEDEAAKQMQAILEPTIHRIDSALDDLQASEQTQSDLKANLQAWSNDQIGLSLLQQVVKKLAEDYQEVTKDGKLLEELLDVQKKLDDTWQSHKSEVDALQRATELEKSIKAERERSSRRGKGMQTFHTSQALSRRVAIQSPVTDNVHDEGLVPVSIEKERLTRRQAASPTSIMKPAVPPADGRPGEQYHKTPIPTTTTTQTRRSSKRRIVNRGAESASVSHSAYNRPVLGTSVENAEAMATETLPTPHKRVKVGTSARRDDIEEEMRQSAEEQPAKLSRSTSNYFREPILTQSATTPLQPQARATRLRGGPIDRRQRSCVTYGESSAIRTRSGSSTTGTLSEGSETSPMQNREPYVGPLELRP